MKYFGCFLLLLTLFFTACKNENPIKSELEVENITDFTALRTELELMYNKDQNARTKLSEMIANGEKFDFALVKNMNIADSINKIRMIEILDEHGWMSKDKIGNKAFSALFLVIQHADLETMQRFFPGLQKYAAKDSTEMTSAALMEDRILMYQSKKQIYGSQASSRIKKEGGNEYFIWPIENPEEVNDRRVKVGFKETVESYAESMNAVYNPQEILIIFGS